MEIKKIKYINSDQFQQINKMWNEEYPIKLKDRFEWYRAAFFTTS
jgi:hypothetical protein